MNHIRSEMYRKSPELDIPKIVVGQSEQPVSTEFALERPSLVRQVVRS